MFNESSTRVRRLLRAAVPVTSPLLNTAGGPA